MSKKTTVIEKLLRDYDVARAKANEAARAAAGLNQALKNALGDTTEVDTPEYICTYKYDKDRSIEVFDAEKFEQKDPKGFAKYTAALELAATLAKKFTTTKSEKGARKLCVTLKNQGDE